MAAGVPLISTALGAEGLTVADGRHILLAGPDDVDAWLAHLQAVRSPARAGIIEAARELVRARYDWSILGEQLGAVYQQWLRA